jgi:hypothetical protein
MSAEGSTFREARIEQQRPGNTFRQHDPHAVHGRNPGGQLRPSGDHTDIAFTEDVAARFVGYGWNVTTVADANDLDAVARALHTFQDTPKAHGAPCGVEGVKSAKRFLGMSELGGATWRRTSPCSSG